MKALLNLNILRILIEHIQRVKSVFFISRRIGFFIANLLRNLLSHIIQCLSEKLVSLLNKRLHKTVDQSIQSKDEVARPKVQLL